MIWIQTCLDKLENHSFFCKAGLYTNHLISSKQKTWYYKLLLNAEFTYCRIQDGSQAAGIRGLGDSDIPQPTVGLPHFCLKFIGPSARTQASTFFQCSIAKNHFLFFFQVTSEGGINLSSVSRGQTKSETTTDSDVRVATEGILNFRNLNWLMLLLLLRKK